MASTYQPFIIVPPLTTCTTAYLVVGDGTPPYKIYPIASGSGNATPLESVPTLSNAGAYAWTVDFNQGANLTWVVSDAANQIAYSEFQVVRSQPKTGITTCAKTVYRNKSDTARDAAIGGSIGGAVLLASLLIAFLVHRRYKKQKRLEEEFANLPRARDSTDSVEMSSRDRLPGATGVARHGTFNLNHVQLNEANPHDAPPMYAPPKRRFRGLISSRTNSRRSSVVAGEEGPPTGNDGLSRDVTPEAEAIATFPESPTDLHEEEVARPRPMSAESSRV